jgi:DNA-binding NarL/FixJ family response regulator
MAREVRTLIVDDQEPFRDALRQLVKAAAGFNLVGEASSGEEAIDAVDELCPGFVLMDVRMPGLGGIEAARIVGSRHPEVVIVLISVHGDEELSPELVSGGHVAAFVHKSKLRPRLLGELWARHQQRPAVHPS